jgi:hypothetical protein
MYLLNCTNTISGALEFFSFYYSGPLITPLPLHVAEREVRFKFSFIVQLYAAHIYPSMTKTNDLLRDS